MGTVKCPCICVINRDTREAEILGLLIHVHDERLVGIRMMKQRAFAVVEYWVHREPNGTHSPAHWDVLAKPYLAITNNAQ